jgi:hypothetical protein
VEGRNGELREAEKMRIYKMTIIVLLILTPARCFETSAQKKQWLSYEPAIVELEGKLTIEWKYGPPNFGENPKTDTKVRVPVLVLAKPVNVHGDQENFPFDVEVKGIRRIQLLVFNLKVPYKQFTGRRVVVAGSLLHAFTGGHYTDVLMNVHSINQLPERRRSPKGKSWSAQAKRFGLVRRVWFVL